MNALKQQRDAFLVVVIASLLVSCSALGLARPQTLEQKIYYAQATANGLIQTLTTLVNQDQVGPDKAEDILFELTRVVQALRSARTWAKTDPNTAQEKFRFANNLLIEVNSFMTKKGGT